MRRTRSRFRSSGSLLAAVLIGIVGCADRGPMEPSSERGEVPVRNEVGAAFTGQIRIGVVPSTQQLSVGSPGGFVVTETASGVEVFRGGAEDVVVLLETPPTVETAWWVQIVCTGDVAARDAYLALAEQLGYRTFTEFVAGANCWRVRIGTWPLSLSFGDWTNVVRPLVLQQFSVPDALRIQMSFAEPATVQVTLGGQTKLSSLPLRIEPDGSLVRINGVLYRGIAEVVSNSTGLLAGVNELQLEEYLYGVVPRELGPVLYPFPEAQKAQAITARTFARAGIGRRQQDGFDLLATTADQVYGGYSAEHPVSTAAVEETRGIVAVYGGQLISTLYHSTSGGYTANSEDVFTTALPYLRGRPDAERGRAPDRVPTLEVFKRHANPVNLRAAPKNDFESDWSQYHRWVVDWSAQEMAQVLSASFGAAVSEVHEINVLARADHGRVLEIEFVTDAGTFVETKDRIRSRLRYIAADGSHANLRSTLFFLEPQQDPHTEAVTGWRAYGGGWGHGVGMSQTGAVGMAERGRTYQEILKHYYQGIDLEKRW